MLTGVISNEEYLQQKQAYLIGCYYRIDTISVRMQLKFVVLRFML